jgi:hypothetical protein
MSAAADIAAFWRDDEVGSAVVRSSIARATNVSATHTSPQPCKFDGWMARADGERNLAGIGPRNGTALADPTNDGSENAWRLERSRGAAADGQPADS